MLDKIKRNILILLACILLCGCTRREQLILENVSEEEEQQSSEQSVTGGGEEQTIFVHVCGAVKNPDVYELPAGSRVYEAVQKAGGFTENADSSYVNQAQILPDGVKLVIPTVEETAAMGSDIDGEGLVGIVEDRSRVDGQSTSSATVGGQSDASDGKININTASEAELCNIPGIGATRAAAIVAYRQEKGGFSSIEDIMNVSGIKEGTYEKIKDSIKIN